MALTTAMLSSSATSPKTTCRPLSHDVTTVVMKNCEPFLFGERGQNLSHKASLGTLHTCWGRRWPSTADRAGRASARSSRLRTSRRRWSGRPCPVETVRVSHISARCGSFEAPALARACPRRRECSTYVTAGEVTALKHEVRDDSVE